MVVDLLEKNRVSVKDLVLPQNDLSLPFDAETDLTSVLWRKMEDGIREGREERYYDWVFDVVAAMKILSPNRNFDHIITKEDWQGFKDEFDELRKKNKSEVERGDVNSWFRIAKSLAIAKLAYPQGFSQLTFPNSDYWALKEDLSQPEWLQSSKQDVGTCEFVRDLKILYPDQDIFLNKDRIWQKLLTGLNYYRVEDPEDPYLALFLSTIRLAFPEEYAKLAVNSEDWRIMKQTLKNEELGGHKTAQQAMDMQILAATKAEVTEKGIELVMPEKAPRGKLPEVRKF